MTLATARKPDDTPALAEILRRAQTVADSARAHAQETEKARRVSAELIGQMRDAGLFKIMQPRRYGGYELGYDVFIEAVATVASGDGSTGWVYSLGAVHQWLMALYPAEAQDEVWSGNPDAIAAVSYAPTGKAVAAPNGVRLSGRWSFASGCDNADWGIVGGMMPAEGSMKPAFFLIPRQDFSIDDDWHTMGLAGTGSKTLVSNDILVPRHRIAAFADLLTGNGPGTAINANPLYRQPMLAVVPHCLVAPALGMARGALQCFEELVGKRTTRGAVAGGNNKMSEFATIQMRIAEATASIDAAQLMMHRDLKETFETVRAGGAVDIPMRMRNRLTHSFATRLLTAAVDAAFTAAGGNALGLHHPLQRFWRDIHAVSSHISLNWDAVSAMYGQHVFGLEPRGQY